MAAVGNQTAIPIQYTQKQRKPCHGPKSPRVQRYSPPAPGYFTVSAATATARGTAKKIAASSHNVMEPGTCAAAGIQRAPTIQAMQKSVRSRSPSSRFSVGSATECFFPQFFADSPQALREELVLAAQPDAEEALQAQVHAGNDQHALVDPNALAQLVARRGGVVAHQAEGAGARFAEGEEAREALHPCPHDRQVLLQNGPGARVEFVAVPRLDGNPRHRVRNLVRPDGEVIVLAPALRDDVRGGDDPADAHARNAVRLGKTAGHDRAIAHAPETAGAFAMDLGALVDLRSEEHTSELQSPCNLVCRLL